MYIIKNAFRCIGRSKGRNALIGIIALVIATSACIGLSIRQAAESAKASALEGMSITATISYDRASAMGQMGGSRPGGMDSGFDRDEFADMMGNASSLTLEEYQKYAAAETVQDFYYTLTAYFNGSESLSPVSDETEDSDSGGMLDGSLDSETPSRLPGSMGGGMMGGRFSGGDFSVIGYSSDNSMSAFVDGTASILEGGTMFEEGTSEYVCVISEELAIYNDLAVGDAIVITNPSLEEETYTLTITGIYTSTANNDFSMSMFGKSQDPANQIYMSANALQKIITASEDASTTVTDDYGRETESKITGTLAATYVFADTDGYYAFENDVRALGLDDSYTVSSTDITAFENSLTPLNTLGKMAGWFLLVILIIGGVILVALNIFNIRERKYEVGVLTAMGMKKWKVAAQFICEILVVTMIAVTIGAGIGAVSSIPVTNALLEGQVESQNNKQDQMNENFGRPGSMGGNMGGNMGGGIPSDMPNNMGGGKNNPFENMFDDTANYITKVDSAMNLTVVFQMLGVGLLLTLIASAASVLFIMRYDPLKILANRD
ncbi:MAG: ABC transporter permease [Clostridia bacterium]|nr:ABC transporter permease [Clostridia bacterium]